MWDDYWIYIVAGFVVIGVLLSARLWGDGIYVVSKHWRMAAFVLGCCAVTSLFAIKQEQFKYEIAYLYYTGTKNTSETDARYQVRVCKEFVQAKIDGRQTAEFHTISAGPVEISSVSNWEYCARTFGLNYWKHDISINGQDGGRLLCEAYARDAYRSSRVQTWCDTVFAPAAPREVGT